MVVPEAQSSAARAHLVQLEYYDEDDSQPERPQPDGRILNVREEGGDGDGGFTPGVGCCAPRKGCIATVLEALQRRAIEAPEQEPCEVADQHDGGVTVEDELVL